MAALQKIPDEAIAIYTVGQTTYVLSQSEKELIEREKTSAGFSLPLVVGFARPDSGVAYAQLGEKRITICLDEGNFLQDYQYDEDLGEWVAGQLNILKAKAHSDTKIAVTYKDGKCHVYFQNEASEIQEVQTDKDGIWRVSQAFPISKPVDGEFAACTVANSIRVFYVNQDNSIYQIIIEDGKWTGELVPKTNDGSPKNIITVNPKGNSFTLQFTDPKNDCFAITDGEIIKIGAYTENGFQPVNSAQFGDVIIYGGNNTINMGGRRRRRRRC